MGSRVSQAGRLFERPVYRGRQARTQEDSGISGLEDGEIGGDFGKTEDGTLGVKSVRGSEMLGQSAR